jgi:hypothetical protein
MVVVVLSKARRGDVRPHSVDESSLPRGVPPPCLKGCHSNAAAYSTLGRGAAPRKVQEPAELACVPATLGHKFRHDFDFPNLPNYVTVGEIDWGTCRECLAEKSR